MALVVLDASVLIAFMSQDDVHHASAVRAFTAEARSDLVAPASAVAEVLVYPYRTRQGHRAERFLDDAAIRVTPIDLAIARRAARLRARHGNVRLPDAFVIATGDELGATRVLTADASWRRLSGRVKVIS